MDKSWMGTNRTNRYYIDGVATFIDYAVHNLQKMGNIDPREHKVEEVQFHLFRNGIDLSYTKWNKHGENDEPSISAPKPVNDTTEFVDDTDFALDIPTDGPAIVEMVNTTKDNFDEDDLVKIVKKDATWKDDKDLTACRTCRISRWKVDNKTHKVYKNIPAKAWRTIDEKFLKIAEDPRNLRLGISDNGVDVNTGNRHHSVWPVFNCHIQHSSMVMYEKKVYHAFGVDTYDASTKYNFNLRAVVLWTINDYPALGTLCGCPYSGFKGCVVCRKDTNCVRLSALSKQSYVGHKQYLPYNHPFRKQKKAFNGQQEFLLAPNPMIGEQIYNNVQHIENKWGKGKRTNNKASENQEDTRGRCGKIQKQKRNTTKEEGSSSQVNRQNGAYWKKLNIWYRKLRY
ncbi:putative transposon, En/Spm-like protein [Tanacetum coccineum]|uniref:Transposon, En/Spm-like protein n=1 Tax=Tanacetum coccineum TaxID=301880 RepID=A0ABQ5BE72_9ASTR